MRFTPHILPSRSGNVGIITLNNPSKLNVLSLEMCQSLNDILSVWQKDKTLRATLFRGASMANDDNGRKRRRAFCAGGDVASLYHAAKQQSESNHEQGRGHSNMLTSDFFREEYTFNYRIAMQCQHNPSVPQISLWDGIVMGGGVGASIHGKYRVATENSLFAMPETAIGLFPDVGGTYWLPRLPGGIGTYLALTGAQLKPDDLIYLGLATHFIPSEELDAMTEALINASKDAPQDVDCAAGVLLSFHNVQKHEIDPNKSFIASHRDQIDNAFGEDTLTVENIMEKLTYLKSEFGQQSLQTLERLSPTSLKVTLEALRRGKMESMDIAKTLQMEFRMGQRFVRHQESDLFEGVRAKLVEKDHSPKWNPSNINSVTNEYVMSFFDSLGKHELELDDVWNREHLDLLKKEDTSKL